MKFFRVGLLALAALAFPLGLSQPTHAVTLPLDCLGSPGVAPIDPGDATRGQVAFVCVHMHVDDLDGDGTGGEPGDVTVADQAGLTIELANTGSHELGHTLGLLHTDGTTQAHLMDVSTVFDGDDRAFSAASQAKLNALATGSMLVFLDFEATSFGNRPNVRPWDATGPVHDLGLNAAQKTAMKQSIKSKMESDYSFLMAGFNVSFTLNQPTELNFDAGQYEIVGFVTPEPSTALLFGGGLVGLLGLARRYGGR